jgi:hypothetical protein
LVNGAPGALGRCPREEFAGHDGSEIGPREFFLQGSKGLAEHTPLDGGDVDVGIEN